MDYTQINLANLIETSSCFSYISNTLPRVTKKHLTSPTISDKVNQVPHDDTLLGKKTKKSKVFHVSPLDIDEETNLRPFQVASLVRKGAKNDLPNLPHNGKLPKPNLTIDSDPSFRVIPLREFFSLEEDISLLESVFLFNLNGVKVAY